MASRADRPADWWRWRPAFPAGVRLDGERIHDDDADASVRLWSSALAVLRAVDGSRSLGELEHDVPGSAELLLELNRAHLVNLLRDPRWRWAALPAVLRCGRSSQPPAVFERISLGRGSASEVLIAVLRGLGSHVLSSPRVTLAWLTASFLVCAAAVSVGVVMFGLALLACFGYVMHEFGHAMAARWFAGRAHVSSSPRGVSVHARLRGSLQVRIFALAGPLLPAGLGALVLAVDAGGVAHWMSTTLLMHLILLVPLFDDGLLLLRGEPSNRTVAKGSLP